MDSSIDIGVEKIMYVKHWLRSFSLLIFQYCCLYAVSYTHLTLPTILRV